MHKMVHKKKKRQKQKKSSSKKTKRQKKVSNSHNKSLRSMFDNNGKLLIAALADKDAIRTKMAGDIAKIEGYFQRYDSIQLLGSIGLYLIDNLPTLEKSFMAQISGTTMHLDEDAEVIAEYALNFGLSMPNDNKENPSDAIVLDLRETLRSLYKNYVLLDMPLNDDAEQFVEWMIHSDTISVRGDGYQEHIQKVFYELFEPHSAFYQRKFGFTIKEFQDFLTEIEDRVICKIGSQNMIYGSYKMWERWRKWDERVYGSNKIDDFQKRDFSNGLFGDFFLANPDVPTTEDGERFLLLPPDDFADSNMIFWVYPQNDTEKNILEVLSVPFGNNSAFIEDGEYKGNIMNGHSIYEKPFVKDEDRFYCFSPMLSYRNMFLIAEKLMMRDQTYYDNNFRNNTSANSRDNYVERKVKTVLQSFLPSVQFYSSVTYNIIEDEVEKKPELDILGVSDKAIYIVEVKAHELTHKDRVGIYGAKTKFSNSVAEACSQSHRAFCFIRDSENPFFNDSGNTVPIDNTKPVYKIAVTFQHYSALLGQMDKLIKAGLLMEEYRDTWIVSLFDLMVCSDFFNNEDEFIAYLEMHKTIYANGSSFNDELDLLGQFLNNDLASKVKRNKKVLILDGHQDIDEEYSKDFKIPMNTIRCDS